MPEVVALAKECWLAAIGDATELRVRRSPILRDSDPMYQPVLQHIAEHGLVEADTDTSPDPGWMFGSVEETRYVQPDMALR